MKKVIVKNNMKTYSTYLSWIEEHFNGYGIFYELEKLPKNDRIYKIIGEAPHSCNTPIELCLIQDIDTKQVYIIDKKGIEFVKEDKMKDIKENKMKDKLKIKIWNYKNVVLYEVLEQDENLRDENLRFETRNGWKICSSNYPSISSFGKEIYIRGRKINQDEVTHAVKCETIDRAKQIVKEVKQAVKEFNESQREILDGKEKEYLSAVIKPFRDRVRYIEKREQPDGEFISIVFKNYENIGLPYFEKNTMYKGMELNREYILEELGL